MTGGSYYEETILSTRKYKAGYEVRTIRFRPIDGGDPFTMRSAFTLRGAYIGSPKLAHTLVVKRGIIPQLASRKHRVCSIGYCARDQRWYGWSHRAICGFGEGDRIYEEQYGNDNTPFKRHGRKTIRTNADAKLAATRFARSVS